MVQAPPTTASLFWFYYRLPRVASDFFLNDFLLSELNVIIILISSTRFRGSNIYIIHVYIYTIS